MLGTSECLRFKYFEVCCSMLMLSLERHISFLMDLKSACLEGAPGNPEFWERVTDLGRDISLVSKSEAMRLGGKSNITEAQATEVSKRSLLPEVVNYDGVTNLMVFFSVYSFRQLIGRLSTLGPTNSICIARYLLYQIPLC